MKFNYVRFTNTALLTTLLSLTLSGLYGHFWTFNGWLWDVHRLSGWILVAVLPWKAVIIWRSLRRGLKPDFERGIMVGVSILLAILVLFVLLLSFGWNWNFGPASYPLRQTAISWHWMLALGLLAPLLLHVWRRWITPRAVDFTSRRAFLRLTVLSVMGIAAWRIAAQFSQTRNASQTRPSGSRLASSFSGNDFPVTHNRAATQEQVNPQVWTLEVQGEVKKPLSLRYEEITGRELFSQQAELDCTLGWYTIQEWSGLPLSQLLTLADASPSAAAVRLVSVTGYSHIFPISEAREILLATHVGGEILDHNHGFPLRAVVPSRRGWFWVKWLSRIEVLNLLPSSDDQPA